MPVPYGYLSYRFKPYRFKLDNYEKHKLIHAAESAKREVKAFLQAVIRGVVKIDVV